MTGARIEEPSSSERVPETAAQRLIRRILGDSLARGDVSRVYGDRIEKGELTIVPVARIGSTFGFGSGAGCGPGNECEGGGGGGRVIAKPIGFLEIAETGSSFKPVYDATKLGIVGILGSTLILWSIIRRR